MDTIRKGSLSLLLAIVLAASYIPPAHQAAAERNPQAGPGGFSVVSVGTAPAPAAKLVQDAMAGLLAWYHDVRALMDVLQRRDYAATERDLETLQELRDRFIQLLPWVQAYIRQAESRGDEPLRTKAKTQRFPNSPKVGWARPDTFSAGRPRLAGIV